MTRGSYSEMGWREWSRELHKTQTEKRSESSGKKKMTNGSCLSTSLCFSFGYCPHNIVFLAIASQWRKPLCHQGLTCGRQLNGHVCWCPAKYLQEMYWLKSTVRLRLGGPLLSWITQSLLCNWTKHKSEKNTMLTYKHWQVIKEHSYKNATMKMCH